MGDIYVSSETNMSHCCVVKSGLSHFAPFVVINTKVMYKSGNSTGMHTKILYCDLKKLNFIDFSNNLASITWPEVIDTEVNDILSLFVRTFSKVVDKHIPLIEKRVKREKQPVISSIYLKIIATEGFSLQNVSLVFLEWHIKTLLQRRNGIYICLMYKERCHSSYVLVSSYIYRKSTSCHWRHNFCNWAHFLPLHKNHTIPDTLKRYKWEKYRKMF